MNKFKKILGIALIAIMVVVPIMSAPVEVGTATVEIVASIGETIANSGIRVIEGSGNTGPINPAVFDPLFFSSPSHVQLATGVDTSDEIATGNFSILVRRPTTSSFTVTLTGTPLVHSNGENGLKYTIKSGSTVFVEFERRSNAASLEYGSTKTGNYEGTSSSTSILRDQKVFDYTIDRDKESPLGIYTSTLTIVLAVE